MIINEIHVPHISHIWNVIHFLPCNVILISMIILHMALPWAAQKNCEMIGKSTINGHIGNMRKE